MKAKAVFSLALGLAVLGLGSARGQTPYSAPGAEDIRVPPAPPPSPATPVPSYVDGDLPPPEVILPRSPCLSDWITYRRPGLCSGPLGVDPPLVTELYLRSGLSFPMGGNTYGQILGTGWSIGGGGRLLLFDPAYDRAWVIDGSITNHYNDADETDQRIPLNIIVPNQFGIPTRVNFGSGNIPGVTARSLNRTFVNLAIGRQYYPWTPANMPGNRLRIGWDAGGGWGTANAEFREIRHRVDVIGRAFGAVYSDLEIPCGCCTFQTGVRTEYSYTWSDILQRESDLQEINLLFNFGVRY